MLSNTKEEAMTYIKLIAEDSAGPNLNKLYQRYKAPWGGVDNILKIHGLLPETLTPHVDLYRTLMFGKGPLTRRQREMIAVVVSETNRCGYCVHHHGDSLYRLTKNKQLADQLKSDYHRAGLGKSVETMLDFAAQLTAKPGGDFSREVSTLKQVGFSDSEILHITLIVAYFNFVNRIANGLGVDLESYWQEDGYSDPSLRMPMMSTTHTRQKITQSETKVLEPC